MKIVILGINSFLGRALTRYFLTKEYEVIGVARRTEGCPAEVEVALWDGLNLGEWSSTLEGADAIVNLAGRTVNCRYSDAHKAEIMESRVRTTQLIGEAIRTLKNPPRVWVNSSTATIYMHRMNEGGNTPHTESDGVIGHDFSMGVAQAWEDAFFKNGTQIRKVAARTAIVLGAEDGTVFRVLSKIVRVGLGGKMGDGRQMFSWIHEYDFCRAVEFLIQNEEMEGCVNVVSPNAEMNTVVMEELRRSWSVPFGLPATKWMLKIGTFLMRSETELVLKSRWVYPERLENSGFTFKMPSLKRALHELKERAMFSE